MKFKKEKSLPGWVVKWANKMERGISRGQQVKDIADETFSRVVPDATNSAFHYAVKMLVKHWEYGEDLRIWYNRDHDLTAAANALPNAVIDRSVLPATIEVIS